MYTKLSKSSQEKNARLKEMTLDSQSPLGIST